MLAVWDHLLPGDYAPGPHAGPINYQCIVYKRARMEGFVVFDYAARYDEGRRRLAAFARSGKLKLPEHIVDGDIGDFGAALQALYRYVNPLVGGSDGGGWPFNRDLNVAQVFALLADIEGVARIDEVLLFPVDLATQQRAPAGQQQIALEPGALFVSFRHIVI